METNAMKFLTQLNSGCLEICKNMLKSAKIVGLNTDDFIIACLDKEFTKLHEQFPFFRYSIIFKKAGSAVVNIHKVFPEHVDAITNILNKSLK
jgi:hypothetical protein